MFNDYDDPGYDDLGYEEPLYEETTEELVEEGGVGPVMIPTPESSNVEEIGYDEKELVLWVRFTAKGNSASSLYWYSGITQDVWESFLGSPSKGQFVWQVLRAQGYEYGRAE